MLIASISEVKNRLSALLDRVRTGETVLIVDRGLPVARLTPALSAREDAEGRLARLERAGIVRRAEGGVARDVVASKSPRAKAGTSVVAALLEERGEGR